jgi:molybdate transport system permease protein
MRGGSPGFGARATAGERSLSFAVHRKLEGFALDVAWETRARRLAILGASGSGKSMTLRLIAGLDAARGGRVVLDGHDLSACPAERRGFGYVPQDYGLFPHLTVAEQLRFAIGYDQERARFWTGRLGLLGLETRKPAALSLGQRQRVALARAFCRPTDLLLLDEPFSALDPHLRRRLRRALRSVQDDVEATTILVTHDPEEAFLLADEVLILDAGRVVQSGAVETVFARPVDEATARLLGADNVAAGQVIAGDAIDIGDSIRLAVAGPALPIGQRVGWSARPDSVRIAPDGAYPATVIRLGPILAGRQEAEVHLGDCRLRAALDPDETIAPGPCRLSIPPRAVQVWPAD